MNFKNNKTNGDKDKNRVTIKMTKIANCHIYNLEKTHTHILYLNGYFLHGREKEKERRKERECLDLLFS